MNGKPENQIIIIAGPNGAGKTTLAPHLLRDRLGLLEYVNADTIAQGLSAFQPEQAAFEAGRIMLKRLRELAGQRKSFAFETTLATRSYAGWLDELRRDGWRVNLIFIWLNNPELAVERVRQRVAQAATIFQKNPFDAVTAEALRTSSRFINRWPIAGRFMTIQLCQIQSWLLAGKGRTRTSLPTKCG